MSVEQPPPASQQAIAAIAHWFRKNMDEPQATAPGSSQ